MPTTWLENTAADPLIAAELAVLRVPLSSAATEADLIHLSAEDRETAKKLEGTPRHPMFVRTRAALRIIAGTLAGTNPQNIQTEKDQKGGFRINDLSSHSFSLSHAGDWLVVAWSTSGPVGVDLEPFPTYARLPALIGECLNPDEARAIDRLTRDKRPKAFAAMWTAKEAFGKAIGTGVMPSPKLMYAQLDDTSARVASFSAPGSLDFTVETAPEIEGHGCALSYQGAPREVHYFLAAPGGIWSAHWF